MWIPGATISQEAFSSDFWRKKATKLCSGLDINQISKHLSQAYLLDLCKNELVESRLVDSRDYSLALGPFELRQLSSEHMLMIQSLESHLESISELVSQYFSFLPRWRIDDVMATIANNDTSCGPHFDNYDVFLIQIRGEKTWQLDDGHNDDSDLSVTSDVPLLKDFRATEKFLQKPGDILYIPPKVGHWGIAGDDSLTLSVGIRNPTLQEMISHFADLVGDQIKEVVTLDDSLDMNDHSIHSKSTDLITQRLANTLLRADLTQKWFGCYMTELREPELAIYPQSPKTTDQIIHWLDHVQILKCQLATRLAFQETEDALLIFVNGLALEVKNSCLSWFQKFEQARYIKTELIEHNEANIELVQSLYMMGAIVTNPSKLKVV